MIDHDNDLFAHAALACAEWIRIAVVDALVLKLFFPFFFELLAVFHLIPFQTGSVDNVPVPENVPEKGVCC